MDEGTARDYIEDLWIEISELRLKVAEQRARLAALEAEVRELKADRDRMRLSLSELANRFSAQEAKHYRIIRSLEALS